MNYLFIIYALYLPLMTLLIVVIGKSCYKNGRPFIDRALPSNRVLAGQLNVLLRVGYYLVNLGYILFRSTGWQHMNDPVTAIDVLSMQVSQLLLLLGILHYGNILIISRFLPNYLNH